MNLIVGLLFIIFILIGVFYLSNIELYRNKDYNKIKDIVIKQTVEAVKTQQETEINIAIEDDLTDAVAAIIVSTDNDTASKLIEEVSNVETETNLSLIAEKASKVSFISLIS